MNGVMSLEQKINQIVSSAAREIASAVRANIAAEVSRLVNGSSAARGPGRKAPAAKAAGKAKGGRRGVDAGVTDKVLKLIQTSPGLRTEEIYKRSGLNAKAVKKSLAKLRADKKVKTAGIKRAMTYAAA